MSSRRVGDSGERCGVTCAEALWRRVPSLARSDGAAADVVKDGRADLTRRRMGEAAAAFVHEELSWRSAPPRYLAALRS
jgi:hypothetical protein